MWNHEIECSYGNLRKSSINSQKGKKERGVIATHTGHVYGTITPNALNLFVPQAQNGKKVAKEEEDRFVKSLKKHQQKFSKSERMAIDDGINRDGRLSTPSSTKSSEQGSIFSFNDHSLPRVDSQKVSTSAYQSNLTRNESTYSNSNSVITELKARQEQKKRAESPKNLTKDEPKAITNIEDAFWVYDDVVMEYKNRHSHLKNKSQKAI